MSKYKVERILNIPVDVMTMEDVKQDLVSNEAIGDKLTLTSVNPQIVLMAEENDTVKTFIENST
ncbi:MAG: glycosyltransferase, partial [Vagococcus sp.]